MSKSPTFVQFLQDISGIGYERERAEFIKMALLGNDPWKTAYWGRYFLPHVIRGDYDTPQFQLDMIESYNSSDSRVDIEPRGFAKSTWRKVSVLKEMCESEMLDGLPFIQWIGSTADEGARAVGGIKPEVERNQMILAVYGELVPDHSQKSMKWNERHMEMTNGGILVSKGRMKGRGINIRNRRPTKAVVDDIEDEESSKNPVIRERLERWLDEVVVPSLADDGTLKMMGTLLLPNAVIAKMKEKYGGTLRKAIEDGKSIWPEMFPMERLVRIRDGYRNATGEWIQGIGSRAFAQEFMNSPLSGSITIFRKEWIDDNPYEVEPDMRYMDVVMAVDPAAGEGSTSDDYGACVMGRHRLTGDRYVLASSKYQGGVGTCVNDPETGEIRRTGARKWFHDLYQEWDPDVAGIEAERTVQAFWQLVRDSGHYRVRKLSASLGIGKRKASKEERAKLVEPRMESGKVKFDPKQLILRDQLIAFPSPDVKDDVMDAFMHANSLLDEGDTNGTSMKEVKKTKSGTSGIRTRNF